MSGASEFALVILNPILFTFQTLPQPEARIAFLGRDIRIHSLLPKASPHKALRWKFNGDTYIPWTEPTTRRRGSVN
ncbi:hypothetical protein HOY80DRAFT_1045677 [Tuber brumale]|nr:hypothetical protein HOY80DRAFT_1045677 [Tuber brumale]